ncbi:heterokaryon incompatibility protein-domain-containing protein [Hypomontagnella monticulosa]|nr:heterokaryon incompatibility protein-domain-containing protein [Hypomontagnella monticulosa]
MAETNVDQPTGFLGARQTFALEMYARPGDVAAKYLKYRPVDTTPNSDQSVLEVQGWVQDCIDNHTECPKPKPGELPTRLIEIENENDLKIVTGVRDGAYAALSYCWGGPQLFALKMENKDKMMKGFKKSDLPLTIQHGITLTRKLGLRYIWIDSLCIIQNDDGDKTKELPKMISTYRNAYITVTSGSSTCYDGFLDRRGCKTHESDDLPPDLLEMRVFCPVGEEEELGDLGAMFTVELPSGPCVLKESKIMIREEAPYMMSSEPISERGWTFQERVLSPRLVLYGQRTTWTCQTKQYSAGGAEDWGRDERSLDISMLALELKSSGADDTEILNFGDFQYGFRFINYGKGAKLTETKSVLPDTWHRAVEEYSSRQLSVPGDKLPAISGVAAAVKNLTSAKYVAGLWEESLLRDLLWSTYPCIVTERPAVWRAPTWSWASCDRRVKFKHISESTSLATARVYKCPVTLKSSLVPLGEVIEEGTELILTTALMPAVSPEIIKSIIIDEDRMDMSTIEVDHASRQRLYEMAKSQGASLTAEDWEVPEYCQLAVLYVELKDVPTELQEGRSEDLAASSSDDDRPLVVIGTLPGNGGRPSDILVMNEGTLSEISDDPFLTSFDREDRRWKVKRDIIMTGLVVAPTPERKWHRLGAFTKTIKGWDKPFFFPWKTIALV